MQISKQEVMDMLRNDSEPGDGGRADKAAQELPATIDTDNPQHQGLLTRFGVQPNELARRFGDALDT